MVCKVTVEPVYKGCHGDNYLFFWLFWTCGCFNPLPTDDAFFLGCMLSVGATILKQKWKYGPKKISIAGLFLCTLA